MDYKRFLPPNHPKRYAFEQQQRRLDNRTPLLRRHLSRARTTKPSCRNDDIKAECDPGSSNVTTGSGNNRHNGRRVLLKNLGEKITHPGPNLESCTRLTTTVTNYATMEQEEEQIARLSNKNIVYNVPEKYICTFSKKIMFEPIREMMEMEHLQTVIDRQSYDALRSMPEARHEMKGRKVYVDLTLKRQIDLYLQRHPGLTKNRYTILPWATERHVYSNLINGIKKSDIEAVEEALSFGVYNPPSMDPPYGSILKIDPCAKRRGNFRGSTSTKSVFLRRRPTSPAGLFPKMPSHFFKDPAGLSPYLTPADSIDEISPMGSLTNASDLEGQLSSNFGTLSMADSAGEGDNNPLLLPPGSHNSPMFGSSSSSRLDSPTERDPLHLTRGRTTRGSSFGTQQQLLRIGEEREMKQWQDGASQCMEEEDPSTFYILFNRRERLHKLAADAMKRAQLEREMRDAEQAEKEKTGPLDFDDESIAGPKPRVSKAFSMLWGMEGGTNKLYSPGKNSDKSPQEADQIYSTRSSLMRTSPSDVLKGSSPSRISSSRAKLQRRNQRKKKSYKLKITLKDIANLPKEDRGPYVSAKGRYPSPYVRMWTSEKDSLEEGERASDVILFEAKFAKKHAVWDEAQVLMLHKKKEQRFLNIVVFDSKVVKGPPVMISYVTVSLRAATRASKEDGMVEMGMLLSEDWAGRVQESPAAAGCRIQFQVVARNIEESLTNRQKLVDRLQKIPIEIHAIEGLPESQLPPPNGDVQLKAKAFLSELEDETVSACALSDAPFSVMSSKTSVAEWKGEAQVQNNRAEAWTSSDSKTLVWGFGGRRDIEFKNGVLSSAGALCFYLEISSSSSSSSTTTSSNREQDRPKPNFRPRIIGSAAMTLEAMIDGASSLTFRNYGGRRSSRGFTTSSSRGNFSSSNNNSPAAAASLSNKRMDIGGSCRVIFTVGRCFFSFRILAVKGLNIDGKEFEEKKCYVEACLRSYSYERVSNVVRWEGGIRKGSGKVDFSRLQSRHLLCDINDEPQRITLCVRKRVISGRDITYTEFSIPVRKMKRYKRTFEGVHLEIDERTMAPMKRHHLRHPKGGYTRLQAPMGATTPCIDIKITHCPPFETLKEMNLVESSIMLSSRTCLHFAATAGDPKVLQRILEGTAEKINEQDDDGTTALHIACIHGNFLISQHLLASKADPNVKDKDGRVALHYCAAGGFHGIMDALLALFANVDVRDNNGWTPLHYAAYAGREKILELLLKSDAESEIENTDGGARAIHLAIERGHLESVRVLTKWKASVLCRDDGGVRPLHLATYRGRHEMVRLLLKNNANACAKDGRSDLWTPLHYAVSRRDKQMATILMDHGDNINIADRRGALPLHYACKNGDFSMTKLLVTRKSNVNHGDRLGRTPMHFATVYGRSDVLRFLVESKGDGNAPDTRHWTPLTEAAGLGFADGVRILMEMKADPIIRNYFGMNALHCAAYWGHLEAAKLIVEKGPRGIIESQIKASPGVGFGCPIAADQYDSKRSHSENNRSRIDSQPPLKDGLKPVEVALLGGAKEIFQYFVDAGANVDYDDIHDHDSKRR